jgi:hypothetical protein
LRLFFTFNAQVRDTLEVEHENERLHELRELLAAGRTGEVDFNGVVEVQNGNEWIVAGVRVLITDQTEIREVISISSPVRVRGITQGNDTILAERIRLLSSDDKLPDVDDAHDENGNGDHSGPGSGDDQPIVEETETPELENDNSGSGNDSNSNENDNNNDNENNNSNDDSASNDNTGGNDNSDDSSGGDSHNNDNGDDSGGGDNSGSGGGGNSGGDD